MKVLEQHQHTKHQISDLVLSKVPEVTLIFWITKILATTFGETAGDYLIHVDEFRLLGEYFYFCSYFYRFTVFPNFC